MAAGKLELEVDVKAEKAKTELDALRAKYQEVARLARETNDKDLNAAANALANQIKRQREEVERLHEAQRAAVPSLEEMHASLRNGLPSWQSVATVLAGSAGVVAGVAALGERLVSAAADAERH